MKKLLLTITIIAASFICYSQSDGGLRITQELHPLEIDTVWVKEVINRKLNETVPSMVYKEVMSLKIQQEPISINFNPDDYYQFKPEKSPLKKFAFGAALTITVFTAAKGFYDISQHIKTGSTKEISTIPYCVLLPAVCATWTIHYSVK